MRIASHAGIYAVADVLREHAIAPRAWRVRAVVGGGGAPWCEYGDRLFLHTQASIPRPPPTPTPPPASFIIFVVLLVLFAKRMGFGLPIQTYDRGGNMGPFNRSRTAWQRGRSIALLLKLSRRPKGTHSTILALKRLCHCSRNTYRNTNILPKTQTNIWVVTSLPLPLYSHNNHAVTQFLLWALHVSHHFPKEYYTFFTQQRASSLCHVESS